MKTDELTDDLESNDTHMLGKVFEIFESLLFENRTLLCWSSAYQLNGKSNIFNFRTWNENYSIFGVLLVACHATMYETLKFHLTSIFRDYWIVIWSMLHISLFVQWSMLQNAGEYGIKWLVHMCRPGVYSRFSWSSLPALWVWNFSLFLPSPAIGSFFSLTLSHFRDLSCNALFTK